MAEYELPLDNLENRTLTEIAKETSVLAHGRCPGFTPNSVQEKNNKGLFWVQTQCLNCHKNFYMFPGNQKWFRQIVTTR